MTILRGADLPDRTTLAAACCIIGAGPAGITLARDLAAAGVDVVVLESGGPSPGARPGQELAGGETDGDLARLDLAALRLRGLGGTSGHWGGLCARLDASDLAPRADVGRPGWPLTLDELGPWYDAAEATCELGRVDWDAGAWVADLGHELPLDTPLVRTGLYLHSPPTRFGVRYREELEASERCTVVLDATVVALDADAGGRHVRAVVARTASGILSVAADRFVLAAGGVDTARLLLLAGLANSSGLVGAGFMDHPHVRVGRIALDLDPDVRPQLRGTAGGPAHEGQLGWLHLTPTPEALTDLGLLNAAMALDSWDSAFPPGRIDAGVAALLGPEAHIDDHTVTIRAEQLARPENRVVLGSGVDRLGLPVARVEWRYDDEASASVDAVARLVAAELGRVGAGRLQIVDQPPVGVGPHHMGTARMSDDPGAGVVNRDGRAHDVDNLYVVGSATFPSSGHANPTLTIVALAHRLADLLAGELTARSPASPGSVPGPTPATAPATGGP